MYGGFKAAIFFYLDTLAFSNKPLQWKDYKETQLRLSILINDNNTWYSKHGKHADGLYWEERVDWINKLRNIFEITKGQTCSTLFVCIIHYL